MVVLRRITEGRTQDTWNSIYSLLKRDARSRKLDVKDVSLKGFSIADKKDTENTVKFDMDLMNTSSGEVIIKSGGKTWKMGDTEVRDRKTGGTKKPDMEAQVGNILDFAQAKIEKNKKG